MYKKLKLALFFTLMAALFALIPLSASADDDVIISGSCGTNMTYSLSTDYVLTISGYGDMKDYGQYTSYAYEYVPWHPYRNSITAVVFDSDTSWLYPGITSIGGFAFFSCGNVTSMDIPSTVTYIGKQAFDGCNFSSITIPEGVTSIGDGAFRYCTSLTSITIPNGISSISNSEFENCTSLTSISLPNGISSIGNEAFDGCSSLKSITLPNGIKSIGYDAFYNCSALPSINLPDGLNSIGDDAFRGCTSLTSITFPKGLNSIGDDAFLSCTALASITFPDGGVETIGRYAFRYCTALKRVEITEGTVSIGTQCFNSCSNLTSVSLPDSLTYLGTDVFSGTNWWSKQANGCVYSNNVMYHYKGTPPETVILKDGTVCIGSYAFYNMSTLKTLIMPDTVHGIGTCAFKDCSSLSYVKMSDNISLLSEYAFEKCTSLKSLRIAGSLTELPSYLFVNCTALEAVTIPYSVTTINANAFSNCTALSDVYYAANYAAWDMIYIDSTGNTTLINNAALHSETTGPAVTGITLDSSSIEGEVGDTYFVFAKPSPAAADDDFTWSSSKPSVASVDDGYITLLSGGIAVVTASSGSASASLDVTVQGDGTEIPSSYPYEITASAIKALDGSSCTSIPTTPFLVEITVSEVTERAGNDYFIAAAYDSEGRLIDFDYIYTNVTDEPLTAGFYISEAASVKIYVWSSLSSMTPLAESVTLGTN